MLCADVPRLCLGFLVVWLKTKKNSSRKNKMKPNRKKQRSPSKEPEDTRPNAPPVALRVPLPRANPFPPHWNLPLPSSRTFQLLQVKEDRVHERFLKKSKNFLLPQPCLLKDWQASSYDDATHGFPVIINDVIRADEAQALVAMLCEDFNFFTWSQTGLTYPDPISGSDVKTFSTCFRDRAGRYILHFPHDQGKERTEFRAIMSRMFARLEQEGGLSFKVTETEHQGCQATVLHSKMELPDTCGTWHKDVALEMGATTDQIWAAKDGYTFWLCLEPNTCLYWHTPQGKGVREFNEIKVYYETKDQGRVRRGTPEAPFEEVMGGKQVKQMKLQPGQGVLFSAIWTWHAGL